MRQDEEPEEPRGGDPVCWLDRVCPQCGRLNTGADNTSERPGTCERCGAELPE